MRLRVGGEDRVTAVAASHGTVWAGSERGRLFRYEGSTGAVEEARSGLGSGSSVTRIYADARTRSALVFVTGADAFLVNASGPVRPRPVAKLKGMRCTAAAWAPVTAGKSCILLGTALGSLFCLRFDENNVRDDSVERLWAAPGGEAVDGVRVERVAGKLVAILATRSKMYAFFDQDNLDALFASETVSAVQRTANGAQGGDSDIPLPFELCFMSGDSALASRRFVWAGGAGVTHALLSVRRRRDSKKAASILANVIDKSTLTWGALKDAAGSGAPLAVNLTAWHVLVLYPGSIFAFNYISGALIQRLDVWSPGSEVREGLDEGDGSVPTELLAAPAAGMARDVARDVLWVFSEDGQLAKIAAGDEQYTDAWRAAKDLGRFDIAMTLAPMVAPGAVVETRQAVLRAQAEDAANVGNWEAAASLFAKTEKPIEEVCLAIYDAAIHGEGQETDKTEKRANFVNLMTEYLVRKLDQVGMERHTQRTLIATVAVQLYAGRISGTKDEKKRGEIQTDFRNFLVDHHADLDIPTALMVLANHGCLDDAKALTNLAARPQLALKGAVQREDVEDALAILDQARENKDHDTVSAAVTALSHALIHISPGHIEEALGNDAEELRLLSALARTARMATEPEKRKEAYDAAVKRARSALVTAEPGGEHWTELAKFLAGIQAEFGDEEGALETAQILRAAPEASAASSALRAALSARQSRTAVSLYSSAGLLDDAVRVAADIDPALAEETLAKNGGDRALWKSVAKVGGGVAVAERSGGKLNVHDVLDGMPQFDVAEEHIKAAVVRELREHRRVADEAEKEAKQAIELSARLRADVDRVRMWRSNQPQNTLVSCDEVIDELDRPFDDPLLDLPV